MKTRVGNLGVSLKVRGIEQSVVADLFADDTVLLGENQRMLWKIVDKFDRVCRTRKLRVNFIRVRAREQTLGFEKSYRIRTESPKECNIWLSEECIEEVRKF